MNTRQIIIRVLLISLFFAGIASADWTTPVQLSGSPAHLPQIAFSDSVLHLIYLLGPDTVCYQRSTDLGQTWSAPYTMAAGLAGYPRMRAHGDTIVAAWQYCTSVSQYNIAITKSTDNGLTWSAPSLILPYYISWGQMHDLDFSGGKISVAFSSNFTICFIRSINWGTSWSYPVFLSSINILHNIELNSLGDTLLMAFNRLNDTTHVSEIDFMKSTNGGQNWGNRITLSSYYSRFPVLAIDDVDIIAVAWCSEYSIGDGDIFVRYSSDHGDTWGSVVQNTGLWANRDIDIAYNADSLYLVAGAGNIKFTYRPYDGFHWAPVETILSNGYTTDPAIAISPGMVHLVWSDSTSSSPGIYYSCRGRVIIPPPPTPTLPLVGQCPLPNWVNACPNICIRGTYAFVAGSTDYDDDDIRIIDMANPTAPFLANALDSIQVVSDMAASGNYLYAVCNYPGTLLTYGISNPRNPILLSEIPHPTECRSLCKRNNLIYFTSTDLTIYDVANPAQPAVAGVCDSLNGIGMISDIDVSGGTACLLSNGMLSLVDINNPSFPALRSQIPIESANYHGLKVAVSGNYAYVITFSPEVKIFDMSDPLNPLQIGTYNLGSGNARDLSIHGNYLIIAHGNLTVADIRDPANPTTIAEYTGPLQTYAATADDNYLYANCDGAFAIFQLPELSDVDYDPGLPAQSSLSQNYPNPFNAQTTIRYSLPADTKAALSIFDISGRQVRRLDITGADHEISWDGANQSGQPVASGLYFYAIDGYRQSARKMLLLR